MKTTTLLLSLFFAAATVFAAEGVRKFTNTKGQQVTASIVSASSTHVTLRIGVKNHTVPINELSPDDQVYIAKYREEEAKSYIPNLEVRFQSGKTKEGQNYDDITQKMSPTATITNRDLTFKVENAHATVLCFGESAQRRNYWRVLNRQEFKFTLEPKDSKEWAGKSFMVVYDELYSKHGHKYDGYIMVIRNEHGKIIHTAGTSRFEKFGEQALKLKEGQDIDRYLKPVDIDVY